MSFGMPCPETIDPMKVFDHVEQYDQTMSSFTEALMGVLAQQKAEIGAALGAALDGLNNRLKTWMKLINNLIGDVYTALSQMVNSQVFLTNTQLATTVQNIGTTLQLTNEEVQYGPYPLPASPQPYPPDASPQLPVQPVTPSPPFAPGTAPYGPPSAPEPLPLGPGYQPTVAPPRHPDREAASLAPQPPTTLALDGVPVNVVQVCQPIMAQQPVNVNGNAYTPTFNVYNSGGSVATRPDGSPSIPVGYSVQPDGSLVVNVGPIYVQVSLPPSDPSSNIPACRLDRLAS